MPNGGIGPQHGSNAHDTYINNIIKNLPPGAKNIRKNQRQADINGIEVGRNRPDVQFDLNGKHWNIEADMNWRNSIEHFRRIIRNGPSGIGLEF